MRARCWGLYLSKGPRFPPRGTGNPKQDANAPSQVWVQGANLGPRWGWAPGKLRLGVDDTGRVVGERDRDGPNDRPDLYKGKGDDRHVVTIAGSRAGKSSTVLIPNLLRYPGSVLVIDPKGELARRTATARRALGQEVIVLDPYGVSSEPGQSYNPLDELDWTSNTFVDDVALVAAALIPSSGRGDPFWPDAARNLLRALFLYMAVTPGGFSLIRLRRMLLGDEGALMKPQLSPDATSEEKEEAYASYIFDKMTFTDEFDGLVARYGFSFQEKVPKEMSSIISFAREQTAFLDSTPMENVLASSSLRLDALKRVPLTVYLCLPAARLATHFRWLRLIVELGFVRLEDNHVPAFPVLFILEEFAALEHMRSIERAAGFFAGFGVRLWAVLQDLTQLKAHYPNSYETFLGNAGLLQAFGNIDITTTEYLSKRLGEAQYVHVERGHASAASLQTGNLGYQESLRSVPLLAPFEIAQHFSRESHRQLILATGWPPIYCNRLDWE